MEISWSSLLTSIFSARAARATLPRVSRNAMRMCCGINGSLTGSLTSSLVVGVVAVIAFVKQRKEGFVFIIVNVQYRNFAALFGHLYGMSGHRVFPLDWLSLPGMTCRLCSTCKPHTTFDCSGTM